MAMESRLLENRMIKNRRMMENLKGSRMDKQPVLEPHTSPRSNQQPVNRVPRPLAIIARLLKLDERVRTSMHGGKITCRHIHMHVACITACSM